MNKIGVLLILFVAILGALAIAREAQAIKPPPSERKKPEGNDVPFATIDSGTMSGIAKKEHFVISEEAEWIALWKRHTANLIPPPPVPRVDFARQMIIAIFSGQHSSGGWAIQVERIKATENKLVVFFSESSPGPGTINTMSLTQPFHIVTLAKSQLPVVFQRQQ